MPLPLLVFLQERQVWGRVNTLESASLKKIGKFGAIGMLSSCLVFGPEMIKFGEYCLLGSMGQIERNR